MKFLVFLFFCVFLYGCLGECTVNDNDEIILVSTIVFDSTVSNETFQNDCKNKSCYKAQIEKNRSDLVQIDVFSREDSLSYKIEHKKWSNVYIVIDSIPAKSCASSYWLADRGYGHYRVESNRLFSCVFYFEPSCE